jgi:hypothetical protein
VVTARIRVPANEYEIGARNERRPRRREKFVNRSLRGDQQVMLLEHPQPDERRQDVDLLSRSIDRR